MLRSFCHNCTRGEDFARCHAVLQIASRCLLGVCVVRALFSRKDTGARLSAFVTWSGEHIQNQAEVMTVCNDYVMFTPSPSFLIEELLVIRRSAFFKSSRTCSNLHNWI